MSEKPIMSIIHRQPYNKALYLFPLSLCLMVIFLISLIPINDFDFWWHLKTGEWIVEHGRLPHTDPFTYTAISDDPEAKGRPFYILTQSWFAEIIYHFIVKTLSFKGFIIMRALIFVMMATPLIIFTVRHATTRFTLWAMIPYLLATPESLTDRPQMFAFFFAILIFFLFEELINGKRYPLFLTPLIMLINANMHGGYLVSAGYILVYLITAVFEKRLRQRRWQIILTGIPSIMVTYLNPNKWKAIDVTLVLYKPEVTSSVDSLEQWSPLKVLPYTYNNIAWLSYWFLVVVSFIAILYLLKNGFYSWAFILSGTAAASLVSMRYIYFFLPISTFAFAYLMNVGISHRLKERVVIEVALGTVVVLSLLVFYVRWDTILKDTYYGYFPEGAADFINRNHIPQPLFNDINWGGYLEWRLYPEYKMFTDTRNLIVDVFRQYMNVLNATTQGLSIIDVYNIKSIITPAINPYNGEIFPLVRWLYRNDDWLLVYLDGVSMVFVKRQYFHTSLPKIYIYKEVLDEVSYWRPSFSEIEGYQKSRREAVSELGKAGIMIR